MAVERGGRPEATLWFAPGPALPAAEVARANAATSDAAASDDSDFRSIMHLGTALTATTLAMGERQGASGRDILAAIVLGYEASGRINDAIPNYQRLGFHNSMPQVFAATVAAGRLLRLDADAMTQAIGLSATSTGGLRQAADTSTAREWNAGQAVMNGLQAALAAAKGFRAEERILEMPMGFFASFGGEVSVEARADAAARLLEGFGESWDIVTDMAVKLMPGAHNYHALAEAAAGAVRAAGISPAEIARITVSKPDMPQLTPPLHPVDLVGMAHSPAYFVAAGAADGGVTWAHATPEKILDPEIHRLIDPTEIAPEPDDARDFRRGARVSVTTRSGASFTHTVLAPRGTAMRGFGWKEIDAKYRALMPHAGIGDPAIERSLGLLHEAAGLTGLAPLALLLRR